MCVWARALKIVFMDTKYRADAQAPGAQAVSAEEPSPPWAVDQKKLSDQNLKQLSWANANGPFELETLRANARHAIGRRIQAERDLREVTRDQMALWLGVHVNTVAKIERGQTDVTAVTLLRIAAKLDLSPQWLLTGVAERERGADSMPMPALIAVTQGAQIHIPLFEARAGSAAFESIENVLSMRTFPVDFIREELRIDHDQLALVKVAGPSMEPLLRAGDLALVDRKDCAVDADGMYLLRLNDAVMIKTLQRQSGGKLQVISQNTYFTPFQLQPGEDADFAVLGRVRWAGVTIL